MGIDAEGKPKTFSDQLWDYLALETFETDNWALSVRLNWWIFLCWHFKQASSSGDPSRGQFKVKPGDKEGFVPLPDEPDAWDRETALRIDLASLIAVESLEEKIASASMQLKVRWHLNL